MDAATRSKVDRILASSRKVFADCSLENGAIVASNSGKSYYPSGVQNYMYVWPRDAGFIIYAADLIGITDIKHKFVDWLLMRCEGVAENGLIWQRYGPDGGRDTLKGWQWQPDQAGAVLWALAETNEVHEQENKVISHIARGLCEHWANTHFTKDAHDVWEERRTSAALKNNFSLTLAACGTGLFSAAARSNNLRWRQVASQMQEALRLESGSHFQRIVNDRQAVLDGSLSGLVWPFNLVEEQEKLIATIYKMEEELMTPEGIIRYPRDRYSGKAKAGKEVDDGGGAWPLLTFWYCLALHQLGRTADAESLFTRQLELIDDDLIPEQLFDKKDRTSIKPLGWAHALFVITAHELSLL